MKKRDPRLTDLEELLRLAPRTGIVKWEEFRRLHLTWAARDDSARQGFKRLRKFAAARGASIERQKDVSEVHGAVVFDPKELSKILPRRRPHAVSRTASITLVHLNARGCTSETISVPWAEVRFYGPEA